MTVCWFVLRKITKHHKPFKTLQQIKAMLQPSKIGSGGDFENIANKKNVFRDSQILKPTCWLDEYGVTNSVCTKCYIMLYNATNQKTFCIQE